MAMSDGTQHAALDALSDLVRTATVHRDKAALDGFTGAIQWWTNLTNHLDAVRTTLIQEGEDYLPVAWAFVDSGRLTIARRMIREARSSARSYGAHS